MLKKNFTQEVSKEIFLNKRQHMFFLNHPVVLKKIKNIKNIIFF